ncbi:MAG: GreA/GreB family elongation factor [Kofleriaceae bacterium]
MPARPAAPHPARAADPPTSSRKAALRLELLRALEHALEIARLAHHAAVEGATHEDARAENDKDTRGLEQSYLARGHARRVAELEAGVAALEAMEWLALEPDTPISLGALVSVEEGDHLRTVLLAAHGGGLTLAGGVTVVTPGSPMGRALLGRVAGDECEVQIGAQPHDLTILTVE